MVCGFNWEYFNYSNFALFLAQSIFLLPNYKWLTSFLYTPNKGVNARFASDSIVLSVLAFLQLATAWCPQLFDFNSKLTDSVKLVAFRISHFKYHLIIGQRKGWKNWKEAFLLKQAMWVLLTLVLALPILRLNVPVLTKICSKILDTRMDFAPLVFYIERN